MSRVGKMPISIPSGVDLKIAESGIEVKGPKGVLKLAAHPAIAVSVDDNTVSVTPVDDSRIARQQHG
ncbi:MAG: 50S ribosomal protein L6, partial [Desulfomicrobium sp.]|nr:50S ribosomal protein L6 [Desulfomicrobium sp.]